MKILITGGLGNIGRDVTTHLTRDHTVIVFDQAGNPVENGQLPARLIVGDVERYEDFLEVAEEVDGIVHLAGVSRMSQGEIVPHRCFRTNINGALNVMRYASQLKRKPWVVVAGTVESSESAYGISKDVASRCLRYLAERHRVAVREIFIPTVYGTTQSDDRVVATMIQTALNRCEIVVHSPTQEMELIHIRDVIAGIQVAIDQMGHRAMNCGYHTQGWVRQDVLSLHALAVEIASHVANGTGIRVDSTEAQHEPLSRPQRPQTNNGLVLEKNVNLSVGLKETIRLLEDGF